MAHISTAPPQEPELIRFDDRPNFQCRIFARVSISTTYDEVMTVFSKLSLLHYVSFLPPKEQDSPDHVALVAYYAPIFAKQACKIFNGMKVNGYELKVWRFSKKCKEINPLSATKCTEVLNYFLGFNRWSSCVKSIQVKSERILGQTKSQSDYQSIATAEVRVKMSSTGYNYNKQLQIQKGECEKHEGNESDIEELVLVGQATVSTGNIIGINYSHFRTKNDIMQNLQKRAVTEARKTALQLGLELVVKCVCGLCSQS